MEKRKPHYALETIKAAFADAASLNRSFVSRQGADDWTWTTTLLWP